MDLLISKASYTETSKNWFSKKGCFKTRSSGYVPKKGDCIYFYFGKQGRTVTHIGLVSEDSNGTTVKTIEGNLTNLQNDNLSEVRAESYSINDTDIVGYGSIRGVANALGLTIGDSNTDTPGGYVPPGTTGPVYCKNSQNAEDHDVYSKSVTKYACRRCDYSAAKPTSQDSAKLWNDDKLKIYALSNAAALYRVMREQGDLGSYPSNIHNMTWWDDSYFAPEACLYQIDQIRRKSDRYLNKYEYHDARGLCVAENAGAYDAIRVGLSQYNIKVDDIIYINNQDDLNYYSGDVEDAVRAVVGLVVTLINPLFGVLYTFVDRNIEYVETGQYGLHDLISDVLGSVIPTPSSAVDVAITSVLNGATGLIDEATAAPVLAINDKIVRLRPAQVGTDGVIFKKTNLNFVFDANNRFKFMSCGRRIC